MVRWVSCCIMIGLQLLLPGRISRDLEGTGVLCMLPLEIYSARHIAQLTVRNGDTDAVCFGSPSVLDVTKNILNKRVRTAKKFYHHYTQVYVSVVPPTGIVRMHYVDATEDIEYKSSAFWQVWLQRSFFEVDIYSVTGESSPDGSLRRVDIVVKRYDPAHDTLSAMLWVECKRPSGSVLEVEHQALDAALRYIATDGLLWIYAMTTVGVSFRSWFVERDREELVPLHGTPVLADRAQYIDADSEDACVLQRTVELVKSQVPLRYAPVLSSQPLTHQAGDFVSEAVDQAQASIAAYCSDPSEGPSAAEYGNELEDSSAVYPDDQAEASTSAKHRSRGAQSAGIYVEVKVERVHHLTRRDEFVFTDAKGHQKSTDRDEWKQITYNGEKVWAFHGKKTTYITRKKVG